jgi:hypothetical protein
MALGEIQRDSDEDAEDPTVQNAGNISGQIKTIDFFSYQRINVPSMACLKETAFLKRMLAMIAIKISRMFLLGSSRTSIKSNSMSTIISSSIR